MPATRVSQDQLAVLGSIFDSAGLQTYGRKLRTQSELMQNSCAMRQQIDAGSEFGYLGSGFYQRHVHATAMKHKCRRQPADSRSDDQNSHANIPTVSAGSS
jgi:hypothetical protein